METRTISIIGGGPAGLRAAEVCAARGLRVTLYDAKRSAGRKFLVAGKGGLNLTNAECLDDLSTRYSGKTSAFWRTLVSEFSPLDLREWAAGLGCDTFETKSGRVYLRDLNAAALLRRWVARLKQAGVDFHMLHRLVGLKPGHPLELTFENGATTRADAVILALGGASWPQTGSDGCWVTILERLGLTPNPLTPANCGWEYDWTPDVLLAAEGKPLKNIRVTAGGLSACGELILTRYGLEGGPLYALGATLRAMDQPTISIDLKPSHSIEQLVGKMESARRSFAAEARHRWKLGDAAHALLSEREWPDAATLAHAAKHYTLVLKGPRPIAETISSAGGIRWEDIDDHLMVKSIPGLFVAGEMIDWEAPTGGYLLQACFSSATRAANAACQ